METAAASRQLQTIIESERCARSATFVARCRESSKRRNDTDEEEVKSAGGKAESTRQSPSFFSQGRDGASPNNEMTSRVTPGPGHVPCFRFLHSSLRGTLVPFQVHKDQGRQAEGPGTGRDSSDTTRLQIYHAPACRISYWARTLGFPASATLGH